MAEAFGREILAGLEVVGFDEILSNIRHNEQEQQQSWFNCPHIDSFLNTLGCETQHAGPLIEVTSIAPQGGKTHLLYYLTTRAVLPIIYGGRESCVIILDTDDSFDVSRLLQQIRFQLRPRISDQAEADDIARQTFDHVYIFKPKGRASLMAVITSLPDWAFTRKHKSLDRPLAFVAIDSITGSLPNDTLADLLRSTSRTLNCAVIIAATYQGRLPKTHDDAIPRFLTPETYSPCMPSLRLIVRRIPVRNIPSSLDEEQKARETAERMKIVSLNRFECVVNLHGLPPQTLERFRNTADGFYFRINTEGLAMEAEEVADMAS